jgi:tetratricopeptide (TPR) repeat protein
MKKGILFSIVVTFTICLVNAQADISKAKDLITSQRYEDATEMFKELIQQQPNNGDVYYYKGINIIEEYVNDPYSNSKANVIKEANAAFQEGLKRDSLNPLNQIGLGLVILFDKGDTLQANNYFKKAEVTIPKKAKQYTPKTIEVLLNLAEAELYAAKPRTNRAIRFCELAKAATEETNPEVFITLGNVYIAANQPSPGIMNYNKALYLDPQNKLLMVNIGNIYIRARNINESRSYFEKAKAIDSTFAPLYKGLGEAYNMGGLYKLSKENYKRFLELSGNNIPAKVSYINSLFKSKDYTETLLQIEDLFQSDKSRNYLNRLAAYSAYDKKPADYDKALNYIEQFFANTTPDKIITKDYIYYGHILLKYNKDSIKVDKGLEMLVKAYEEDPTNSEILDEVAVSAYFNKRYDMAIEMLNKKITEGQANTNDYMYLGKAYYMTKDYQKADSVFTSVTVKEPANVQAYLWIANTYFSLDPNSEEGLAYPKYEKVIEVAQIDTAKYKNELFESYSYMGSNFLLAKKPDYEKAANYYQKMLYLDPANKKWQTKGYLSLGVIYTKRKEYNTAISYYKKAQVLNPGDADIQKTIDGINKAIAAQNE